MSSGPWSSGPGRQPGRILFDTTVCGTIAPVTIGSSRGPVGATSESSVRSDYRTLVVVFFATMCAAAFLVPFGGPAMIVGFWCALGMFGLGVTVLVEAVRHRRALSRRARLAAGVVGVFVVVELLVVVAWVLWLLTPPLPGY